MIVPNRFTLDTNVLIYAVDTDADEKHKSASTLLTLAVEKDCVLTLQALSEFFNAVRKKNKASTDTAIELSRTWQQLFPIASAGPETLNEAIEVVRDHQLSFWDAMLWMTAKEAGCAYLFSEDMQHGRRLGGVEIINPFAKDAATVLETVFGKAAF